MCTQAKVSQRKKGRQATMPGYVEDAAALGVNPSHLFRVISGRRYSKTLLARYVALKAEQEKGHTA